MTWAMWSRRHLRRRRRSKVCDRRQNHLLSYVEQKLKEIKSAFKKDYDRNNQYVKFFKKVNKQVKTEVNDDVKREYRFVELLAGASK